MNNFRLVFIFGFVFSFTSSLPAAWPVGADGNPQFVKGVTFTIKNTAKDPQQQRKALREVKNIGAQAIRTWGVGDDTMDLLDNAEAEGLKVLLGLWLEHGRNGAESDGNLNYARDEERKVKQKANILKDVARYKDHPALLGWGVGNEVILNIGSEDEKIAYAKYLEEVVQGIKQLDSDHPVMSVSAWTISVPYWEKYTPSLDAYGINSYGPAAGAIPGALKEHGAGKVYLVTEFGPRGAWDSPKDEFGVPQMPSDIEKYDQISQGWGEWIEGNRARGCAGGFVFNFGDFDSPTSIWLDFYVKGLKRPAWWATRKAFTGKDPEVALENFGGLMVSPRTVQAAGSVKVGVEPLKGIELKDVSFIFSPEFGGRDNMNRMLPAESTHLKGRIFELQAPQEPGVYRIYGMKKTAGGNVTITQSSVKVDAKEETSLNSVGTTGSLAMTLVSSSLLQLSAPAGRGSKVEIRGDAESGFTLLKNGQPFVIKGAGGTQHFDVMAANGGNTIRTWGVGKDTRDLLDRAHANGLSVTIGLWLGHERHNFNYSDPKQLADQRASVEAAVLKFKNHPALLSWGLGNEMEGIQSRGDSPLIWKEVNLLAKKIKELDPNHPVMTVVANVNPDKVKAVMDHAPEVDILGVNAYAGAQNIGKNLKNYGWIKPYAVTEYGLPGPWEVAHTKWDAPIEPTSREKAGFYFVATKGILEDTKQCLGAYAFLWGSKQEATASWFGMFLPSGEKTPRVDAVTKAWTGNWPANRAPILKETVMPMANEKVKGGMNIAVKAQYKDADGDPLTYTWEVLEESTDRKTGGDAEAAPDKVANAVRALDAVGNALLTTPGKPGAYRLFVTVRDGKGSGCMDNWPFYVE